MVLARPLDRGVEVARHGLDVAGVPGRGARPPLGGQADSWMRPSASKAVAAVAKAVRAPGHWPSPASALPKPSSTGPTRAGVCSRSARSAASNGSAASTGRPDST